jgi:hypothetical protein
MASTRQVVGPVLTMFDDSEASPETTADWARELLAMEGGNGTPEREVQRMYLKTVLALCQFDRAPLDEAEMLLREAALVAERLHRRLSVLLAWYLAHVHYRRTLSTIGEGGNLEQAALAISIEFATVAKVAEEAHNIPLHAGLAYSVAAEYALRGDKQDIAQSLAGRSVAQFRRVVGTDDPRIERRMVVNEMILSGTSFAPSDVLDLLTRPGELQDTLPGE